MFIPESEIADRANAVLEKYGLIDQFSRGSAVNPVTIATGEGIDVFALDFPTADDSVCGILRKEDGKFRIYVNQDHHGNRIRYTIAHELGHYFLHRDSFDAFVDPEINMFRTTRDDDEPADQLRRQMEIQANMFAAALLMPAAFVRDQYKGNKDISALAKRFGVSREAMGHRIANLGL